MTWAHKVNYSSQEALDAARAATQNKYKRMFSKQIEEAARRGETPVEAMDFALWHSRVGTRDDHGEYKWAFEPLGTNIAPWRKWGGGNKKSSGTNATRMASIGKIKAALGDTSPTVNRSFAPDANVNNYVNRNFADMLGLTPVTNFLSSRLNATPGIEGKFMSSNPSYTGVGSNPNYGVPSLGSFDNVSSFSNFTGGLPSFDQSSVEHFSLSDPSSVSSSFRAAGDVFGKSGGGSGVPFADEIPIPSALPVDNSPSSFSPSNYLVLGSPYSRITYY